MDRRTFLSLTGKAALLFALPAELIAPKKVVQASTSPPTLAYPFPPAGFAYFFLPSQTRYIGLAPLTDANSLNRQLSHTVVQYREGERWWTTVELALLTLALPYSAQLPAELTLTDLLRHINLTMTATWAVRNDIDLQERVHDLCYDRGDISVRLSADTAHVTVLNSLWIARYGVSYNYRAHG